MTFHQPSVWLMLLVLALPVIWWQKRGGRRRGALVFSSIGPLEAVGGSWAVSLHWVVPALRTAAIILLIICVARPQKALVRSSCRCRVDRPKISTAYAVKNAAVTYGSDAEPKRHNQDNQPNLRKPPGHGRSSSEHAANRAGKSPHHLTVYGREN